MACNICLDVLDNPHVTPCGHVFCLRCLISSSQKSPDATKAPCPTCRTTFSLVSPDRAFVPEKYRPFIDSNIRKVYMDTSTEASLQKKVARLEARVKSLERDKDLLMARCESYMTAATSHAQREKEARTRCVTLQRELKEANQCFAKLIQKETRRTIHALWSSIDYVGGSTSSNHSPKSKTLPLPRKRESNSSLEYDSGSVPPLVVPTELRHIVPLPKRRRVSRLPPDGQITAHITNDSGSNGVPCRA